MGDNQTKKIGILTTLVVILLIAVCVLSAMLVKTTKTANDAISQIKEVNNEISGLKGDNYEINRRIKELEEGTK